MKVNRTGSPLSSGAESVDSVEAQELQKAVKSEKFAAALSQLEAQATAGAGQGASASASSSATRAMLEEIATGADLATNEGAAMAVRESARFMIRSRLSKKFGESEQAENIVENLSEYVASDPLLKLKLLTILQRLKAA